MYCPSSESKSIAGQEQCKRKNEEGLNSINDNKKEGLKFTYGQQVRFFLLSFSFFFTSSSKNFSSKKNLDDYLMAVPDEPLTQGLKRTYYNNSILYQNLTHPTHTHRHFVLTDTHQDTQYKNTHTHPDIALVNNNRQRLLITGPDTYTSLENYR